MYISGLGVALLSPGADGDPVAMKEAEGFKASANKKMRLDVDMSPLAFS